MSATALNKQSPCEKHVCCIWTGMDARNAPSSPDSPYLGILIVVSNMSSMQRVEPHRGSQR